MPRSNLKKWLSIATILLILGAFSNWLVKEYNGGKMPVMSEKLPLSDRHVLMDEQTRFPWLADWISEPFLNGMASPGDIFTYIGFLICGLCLFQSLIFFLRNKKCLV